MVVDLDTNVNLDILSELIETTQVVYQTDMPLHKNDPRLIAAPHLSSYEAGHACANGSCK